jgi:hypothetical protein
MHRWNGQLTHEGRYLKWVGWRVHGRGVMSLGQTAESALRYFLKDGKP